MKLDLRQFEQFPVNAEITAEELDLGLEDSGVNEVKTITATLAIQESGQEFFCQGTIEAAVVVECVRCLAPVHLVINEETDFVVCAEGLHKSGHDEPVDVEEYIYYAGKDPVVDLAPLVREAVILGIGMKPVCQVDVEACNARQEKLVRKLGLKPDSERIDPRWEALLKLKETESRQK